MIHTARKNPLVTFVEFAILLALEFLFCFTVLGSIPIGPVVATTMMVPVIVCSITLGKWYGLALGGIAGLFSFIVNSFITPTVTSFMFTPVCAFPGSDKGTWFSLIICFLPRALGGFLPGLVFEFFRLSCRKKRPSGALSLVYYGICGFLGSAVNTIGVLGLFWSYCTFFQSGNLELLGTLGTATVGAAVGITVLTNGLPEAILAVFVGAGACKPINHYLTYNDF